MCALGMACCSLFLCFSSDIWYDELFTVGFVSQPVGRMISLAARDVHPPLYYLMIKAAVELVHLFAPGADAVIICKVVSVLPYLALLGYSLTLIRKKYGWLCSGLFPSASWRCRRWLTIRRKSGCTALPCFYYGGIPACGRASGGRRKKALGRLHCLWDRSGLYPLFCSGCGGGAVCGRGCAFVR